MRHQIRTNAMTFFELSFIKSINHCHLYIYCTGNGMAFDFKSWQSRQVPNIHAYQKGMDKLILFVSAVNSNNIHKQILFCISVFWQKSVFWEWCDLQRISFEWHWWTLIQIYSHQMVCWKGEFNFNLALTNLLNTLPVVIENNFGDCYSWITLSSMKSTLCFLFHFVT